MGRVGGGGGGGRRGRLCVLHVCVDVLFIHKSLFIYNTSRDE